MKNNEKKFLKELETDWEEGEYEQIPESGINESWKRLERQLSLRKNNKKSRLHFYISRIAAVLFILFAGHFFLNNFHSTKRVTNNTTEEMELTLSDGSLVLLKPGSEISYQTKFKNSRGVSLQGEAFFEVKKDSLREFVVRTENATVKVLGTSFSVKDISGVEDANIKLHTGRVSVSVKGRAELWTLVPGEEFSLRNGKIDLERFQPKPRFEPGQEYIDFDEVELMELIAFLETRFGYKIHSIQFPQNKKITIRINKKDSLPQILEVVSILNQAAYDIDPERKQVKIYKK